MNQQIFDTIFKEYCDGYEEGNAYDVFDKYENWLQVNKDNGVLKSFLLKAIKACLQEKNFKQYDFVLLIIQAIGLRFEEADEHFDLLFVMADLITEDFKFSAEGDRRAWLLHQLADICTHRFDEVANVVKKNSKLVAKVIEKIGNTRYEPLVYGPQMYFAAYKSICILQHLDESVARIILDDVFLRHFDTRVIEEAEEFK